MRTVRCRCLAILSGALVLALASGAAADSAPAVSRGPIADDMTAYYRSERNTAFTFIGIGAVSAGVGTALVTTRKDFAVGLGFSMIGIGALEVLGSTFYALQVGAELDHYSELLARDPAAFKREEGGHIHGTTSRFFWYRTAELVLVIVGAGVATYGFASDKDVWKGAGIGVAGEAATFFVLDAFGASRAEDYEERVRQFDPTVAFSVGGGERPWSLSVSGRF
jgi:hypothetical protein